MVMGTWAERERERGWGRANERMMGTETRVATGRERGWGPGNWERGRVPLPNRLHVEGDRLSAGKADRQLRSHRGG